MEQRFIKTGLEFFGHHQDVALIVEDVLRLRDGHMVAVAVDVHTAFGVFDALRVVRVNYRSGKGDHHFQVVIMVGGNIAPNLLYIAHRRQAGRRDHHHFAAPADFVAGDVAVGLHDDGRFLLQIVGVQL